MRSNITEKPIAFYTFPRVCHVNVFALQMQQTAVSRFEKGQIAKLMSLLLVFPAVTAHVVRAYQMQVYGYTNSNSTSSGSQPFLILLKPAGCKQNQIIFLHLSPFEANVFSAKVFRHAG